MTLPKKIISRRKAPSLVQRARRHLHNSRLNRLLEAWADVIGEGTFGKLGSWSLRLGLILILTAFVGDEHRQLRIAANTKHYQTIDTVSKRIGAIVSASHGRIAMADFALRNDHSTSPEEYLKLCYFFALATRDDIATLDGVSFLAREPLFAELYSKLHEALAAQRDFWENPPMLSAGDHNLSILVGLKNLNRRYEGIDALAEFKSKETADMLDADLQAFLLHWRLLFQGGCILCFLGISCGIIYLWSRFRNASTCRQPTVSM
jgi:hypothetical protein